MRILIWIAIAGMIAGCSKAEAPAVAATNALQAEAFDLNRLDQMRVKELLVVIFDHNYSVAEWKAIFDQTKSLSANRRLLRLIEGRMDTEADQQRGDLIAANADLLMELGNQSLFIMSWSVNDENCHFSRRSGVKMSCKPKSQDNPLNGGLPAPVGIAEWVIPDPIIADTKSPHLRLFLKHEGDPGYELELRLKIENISTQELWFKGEAVPSSGSQFPVADGTYRASRFPYGYAEMTLSP